MTTGKSMTRRAVLPVMITIGVGLSLTAGARAETPLAIKVWKDPDCGCCTGWVNHLRRSSFAVSVTETAAMQDVKGRLGVPTDLASCHTAEIAGYVIEGHVPAHAITRFIAEKSPGWGLAVPGMPIGSPGMEGGTPEIYEVILFGPQPNQSFGRYRGEQPV